MTKPVNSLKATVYTAMFLIAVLCLARWAGCCRARPLRPGRTPTTIPVILDDPLTDDIDERIRRAEDE